MASITDLAAQSAGQVSDSDLLLTHQPISGGYEAKRVLRSAFLTGVLREGGAANVESLTADTAIAGDTLAVNSAAFANFIQIGGKVTRTLVSAPVTEAVSAAAGASDSISVPLTGALVGDFVLVHATGLSAGIIASGVASAGSVSVTIFNATGSPFADDVTVKVAAIRMEA